MPSEANDPETDQGWSQGALDISELRMAFYL